jgi:hypothetical protein
MNILSFEIKNQKLNCACGQALAQAKTESSTDVDAPEESPMLPNGMSTSFDYSVKEENADGEVLQ